MHSFLILSSDENTLENEVNRLCDLHHIGAFDKIIVKKEKNIGIEDIRNLQKDLLLTPLKSPQKAGIVYRADTMTADAQNAFLKTLEEPPPHTIIMLLGEQKEYFLPTVLSRCSIISTRSRKMLKPTNTQKSSPLLQQIQNFSIGEKLKQAESISKTREEAITWLEDAIYILRDELLSSPHPQTTRNIRHFQNTYLLLKKTNANTRVAIEHLLLSL